MQNRAIFLIFQLMSKITVYLTLLLSLCLTGPIAGQSIVTQFGKNRVQYHNDQYNWSRYETENFMTYWYGKSRNISQTVIQMAELDYEEIQKVLEHTLGEKIEILVYTDLSDLKQANIGNDDAFVSNNDETVVEGDKMLVYFNGDHNHLRQQIRRGVAEVYVNSILYGSNLQEIVQNALLLNLPEWFTSGVVSYAGSQWNHEIDDELRDLLDNPRYYDFKKLSRDHPRVAGHSLWNYIDHTFGSSTIANIIYLTRISRNLENSFLFITGVEYDVILSNWMSHYVSRYTKEDNKYTKTDSLSAVKLKNKKGVPISQYRFNHDGSLLAYIINDRGKNRVYVRDMQTGEERMIFKTGTKNLFQETDFNYPLVCWHPRYPELSILYEHRDVVKLRKVDLKQDLVEEEDFTTNFQRVYSIDCVRPDEYVISASSDGYADLYYYQADKRHHKRITHDFYDDLDAVVINYKGSPSILFKSNRADLDLGVNKLDTILPLGKFDLFLLKGLDKDSDMIRLTQTSYYNEGQARQMSEDALIYLSEKTGIVNAYSLDLNTGKTTALTNGERNIIVHDYAPSTGQYIYNYYYHGNYDNFLADKVSSTLPYVTEHQDKVNSERNDEITIPYLPQETSNEGYSDGMKFQSEFEDADDIVPLDQDENISGTSSLFDKYFKDYFSDSFFEGKPIINFVPARASATRERFRLANFTSRLDNEVLFEGLESYTGEDKDLENAPVGFLLKADIKDLLEDYEIAIGLRLSTNFDGYEYFVTIDDNQAQWDKRYAFYRRSETSIVDEVVDPFRRVKRHTFLGLYRLKYPFDVYQSLRFTGSLRLDKLSFQIFDLEDLEQPINFEKRLSLRTEYVYDNSFDVSINIKNGTRAKFFVEGINEFDLQLKDGFEFDPSTGMTGIVGFDARHYIPIFKRAVLALRGTGATSFGSRRVVYYLGGVEGWIFNSSEPDIPVPGDDGNAFKVLAPQLRGFRNNIRNGNSYVLTNIEFRFPLGQFIGFQKSRFAFFRNLQIASFFDGGLAWYGLGPDEEDNPLNTIEAFSPPDNPSVSVQARFFRNPTVYGYGVGIRSTMLGYFVKFDYAWGVETGLRRDPRLYFSLGLDF